MFSSVCAFFQGCPRPPQSVKPNLCQPPSLSPFSPKPPMCESLCIVSKWLPQGWYEPPQHAQTHTHARPVVIWSSLCIFTVDCTVWIVTKQTAVWAFKGPSPPPSPPPLLCPVGLTFRLFTSGWRHASHSGLPRTLRLSCARCKGHELRPASIVCDLLCVTVTKYKNLFRCV